MATPQPRAGYRFKQKKKERRPRRAVPAIAPGQKTCSVAQAAFVAGVAVSTVWLWLNGNRLASRSVGGRRLINVASLYELIGVATPDGQQGDD
jgi:hypothetical protein